MLLKHRSMVGIHLTLTAVLKTVAAEKKDRYLTGVLLGSQIGQAICGDLCPTFLPTFMLTFFCDAYLDVPEPEVNSLLICLVKQLE